MRTVVVGLVVCGFAVWASGELTSDQAIVLAQAFEALQKADNPQAAGIVLGLVRDSEVTDEDWLRFFSEAFEPTWFTQAMSRFWDYASSHAGANPYRVSLLSAYCASSAAGRALATGGPGSENVVPATAGLSWLDRISARITPDGRAAVLSFLEQSLGKSRGPLLPGPGADPRVSQLLLRLSLVLGVYAEGLPAGRTTVGRLLQLPESHRVFWEKHGVFLYDNMGLDAGQIAGLDMLMSLVPVSLHRIVALIATETTGIDPTSPGVATPGQLVFMSAIPMGRMTEPGEFIRQVGQPVAPLFTISAAQQVVRAIQQEQFRRRPDLANRRDLILMHAKGARERYLRRFVPPETYLQQPDELLPAVAFLWFINTGATFRTAMDLFDIEKRDAMDSFLLLADLLSGGGNTTLLFSTNPDGRMFASSTPISRTHRTRIRLARPDSLGLATPRMPANLDFVTGIAINGYRWTFDLNELGGTIKWTRR